MSETPHLFGLVDAELLYDSVAKVYEFDIEPWLGDPDNAADAAKYEWIIEEHTTQGPLTWMPRLADVQVWLAETICEEHDFEDNDDFKALTDPNDIELLSAIEGVLVLCADRCKWLEADKKVATHKLTIEDGEPHLNGKPLYVKASSACTTD